MREGEPPVVGIVRGEAVEELQQQRVVVEPPAEGDEPEGADGQAEHEGVPGELGHLGADGGQRAGRIAVEQDPDGLHVLPLASRHAARERARLRDGGLRLRDAPEDLMRAGQPGGGECEAGVSGQGGAERAIGARRGPEKMVHALAVRRDRAIGGGG